MNWRTGVGLGRRPHTGYTGCLEATRHARGGVVCTNTGVGYKSAHIESNMWCGSSSALRYCLEASAFGDECVFGAATAIRPSMGLALRVRRREPER